MSSTSFFFHLRQARPVQATKDWLLLHPVNQTKKQTKNLNHRLQDILIFLIDCHFIGQVDLRGKDAKYFLFLIFSEVTASFQTHYP